MLGERIPAEQALEWGLISRVVEDEELAREATALAARLAAGADRRLRPDPPARPRMPSICRSPRRSPPSASPSATPAAPRISSRRVIAFLQKRQPTLRRPLRCRSSCGWPIWRSASCSAITPGPAVLLDRQPGDRPWASAPASRSCSAPSSATCIYFVLSAAGVGVSARRFGKIAFAGAQICRRRLSDLARPEHDLEGHGRRSIPADASSKVLDLAPSASPSAPSPTSSRNPKSILFWAALFPQFVDYRGGNVVLQFGILAGTAVMVDILVLVQLRLDRCTGRKGDGLRARNRRLARAHFGGRPSSSIGAALSLAGQIG